MKINAVLAYGPICVIAAIQLWARSKPGNYGEVSTAATVASYLNLLVCLGTEFQGKASSLVMEKGRSGVFT